MLKFISRTSNINVKKQIDQKLQHASTFDVIDLVKFMGSKNEEEALRKLFKIIGIYKKQQFYLLGILDIMLTKLTEYNIISYLKYQQIFEALRKQFNGAPLQKTATMDGGIVISRFQSILANLEREYELFSYVGKLMQTKGTDIKVDSSTDNKTVSITSLEELYQRLKSGEHFGFQGEVTVGLINLIEASLKKKEPELKKEGSGSDVQKKEVLDLQKKLQKLEAQLNEKTAIIQHAQKEAGEREELFKRKEKEFVEKVQNIDAGKKKSDTTFQTDTREQELTRQLGSLEKIIKDLKDDLAKKAENEKNMLQEIKTLKEKGTQQSTTKSQSAQPGNNDYYLTMIQQLEENLNDKNSRICEENLKLSNDVAIFLKF
jgi:hypothetical protein